MKTIEDFDFSAARQKLLYNAYLVLGNSLKAGDLRAAQIVLTVFQNDLSKGLPDQQERINELCRNYAELLQTEGIGYTRDPNE